METTINKIVYTILLIVYTILLIPYIISLIPETILLEFFKTEYVLRRLISCQFLHLDSIEAGIASEVSIKLIGI